MLATSSPTSRLSIKVSRTFWASSSLLRSASSTVRTFNSQPPSSLARRTFWPPRPMAWERFDSSTAMSMDWRSSSTTIAATSAGAMALITNWAGLSSHRMMSIRSPASSLETACTREPRMPTQAPIGSVRLSFDRTAILARRPGSRAPPIMVINPWPISGTSSSNKAIRNSLMVRLAKSCGPRISARTS